MEHLEDIPTPGTSIELAGHPVEIVQTKGNAVKIARLKPRDEDPDKVQAGASQ